MVILTISATLQKGIYLVPFDYNGPISSYYMEWGGTKPHATIAGFENQRSNINQIVQLTAKKSMADDRWTFSCEKNKCYVERSGSLKLMKFSARTVTNISYYLKQLGIKNLHSPNPCHITLCKTSETSFSTSRAITALEAARDWRLVVVDKNGSVVTWKNNYDV